MAVDIIKNASTYLCAEACTKNTYLTPNQHILTHNNNMTISFSDTPASERVTGIKDPEYYFTSTTLKVTGNVKGNNISYLIYGEVGTVCRMGDIIGGNVNSFDFRQEQFLAVINAYSSNNYEISFWGATTNRQWEFLSDATTNDIPGFYLFISNTYLKNIRCYYVSGQRFEGYDEVTSIANRIRGSVSLYKNKTIYAPYDKTMCAPYYQEGYSGKMTLSKYGVYVPGELIENKTAYKFTKTGNIEASEFIEY